MNDHVKKYTNGEITIVWKPSSCTYAAFCWEELPEVFIPNKRPWINAEGGSTEQIIQQIKRCPSGALSYYLNDKKEETMEKDSKIKAEVMHNGPLIINSSICVKRDGTEEEHPKGAAFCRCGKSNKKPYCDGSHMKHPFE